MFYHFVVRRSVVVAALISDLSAPAHPYQQQLVILHVHQKVFFLSKWAVLGQNKLQNAVELMLIVKYLSGLYHKYYLSSLSSFFVSSNDLIEFIAWLISLIIYQFFFSKNSPWMTIIQRCYLLNRHYRIFRVQNIIYFHIIVYHWLAVHSNA